jgi:osmotically inducible protein OsmC
MKRKASAVWQGGLKDGKGSISTDSGVLADTQYSFSTRFEDGKGTNPEELIAAAHAGCFSMALSGQLGNAGLTADSINTVAAVTLEKTDAGFTITKVHLDVTAKIPGASAEAFQTAAGTRRLVSSFTLVESGSHNGRQTRKLNPLDSSVNRSANPWRRRRRLARSRVIAGYARRHRRARSGGH